MSTETGRPPLHGAMEGSGKHILLVEDDLDTSYIMAKLLRRAGYSVTAAATCREALTHCEMYRFDAAVVDVGLPDGSGNQLIGRLRQEWGVRGIAVSGHASEQDRRAGLEAGFDFYLVKPVAFDDVRKALFDLLAAANANSQADAGVERQALNGGA